MCDELWAQARFLSPTVTCGEFLDAVSQLVSPGTVTFVPRGVLTVVQAMLFGPTKWVSVGACRQLSPAGIHDLVLRQLRSLPELSPVLKKIITEDITVADVASVEIVLRDIDRPFDELAKLRTEDLRLLLQHHHLSVEDSRQVALGIYTARRRQISNAVELPSPLEAALRGLAANDENVSLSHCQLDDAAFRRIADNIVADGKLRSLDLSGNFLHTKGAELLGSMLPKMGQLRTLVVRGNTVLHAGVECIAKGIKQQGKLQSLDLSGCRAGKRLHEALAALDGMTSLNELRIAGCDLEVLRSFPSLPSLLSLDVGSNHLTTSGIAALSSVLQGLPQLRTLSLRANHIDDNGATTIAHAIRDHGSIRTVDVSFSPMGDVGLHALRSLLDEGRLWNVVGHGTCASEAASAMLQSAAAVAHTDRARRLDELRSVPLSQWSTGDVELFASRYILEKRTVAALHNVSGAELAAQRTTGTFTLEDWDRLQQFQQ